MVSKIDIGGSDPLSPVVAIQMGRTIPIHGKRKVVQVCFREGEREVGIQRVDVIHNYPAANREYQLPRL